MIATLVAATTVLAVAAAAAARVEVGVEVEVVGVGVATWGLIQAATLTASCRLRSVRGGGLGRVDGGGVVVVASGVVVGVAARVGLLLPRVVWRLVAPRPLLAARNPWT